MRSVWLRSTINGGGGGALLVKGGVGVVLAMKIAEWGGVSIKQVRIGQSGNLSYMLLSFNNEIAECIWRAYQ